MIAMKKCRWTSSKHSDVFLVRLMHAEHIDVHIGRAGSDRCRVEQTRVMMKILERAGSRKQSSL